MKRIIATIEIWKEGGMFTVYCPELDVASCGPTAEKAKKKLKRGYRDTIGGNSQAWDVKRFF
jgi:hypothetical protein